jgi:quinol monooxygenase YgiN
MASSVDGVIVKVIRVRTADGRHAEYLRLQETWTAAMAAQPGFRWCHVGVDVDDPGRCVVIVAFGEQADLDRFMAHVHDDLVAQTSIADTYDDIDVAVYDVVASASELTRPA